MSGHDGSQGQSLTHSEPTQSQMSGPDGSQEKSLIHSEPTQSQMSGHDGTQEQSLRHSEPTQSQTPGNDGTQEQSSRHSEPTISQTTSKHAEHHRHQQRPSKSSNPPQSSGVMDELPSTSGYDGSQAAHASPMAEGRSSRKRRISGGDHDASAVPRKRGNSFAMQLN